jgi:Flp pilus assembly protein TadD
LAAARSIEAEHPDVATLSARLALEQQRVDVALAELERAANADPRNAERWHRLGRLQLGSGNFAAARISLGRALDLAPHNPSVRFDLGQAEAALGNTSAARLLARELQADFPELALGYVLEGDLLAAAGDHPGAVRLFERAYEQRPAFELAARAHQARRAAAMNDVTTPLERWVERTPGDARAWLLLAEAHERAGRAAAALPAYEKVIALEPNNVIALNNAAWIHNEAGNARALDYARRAVDGAPTAPPVLDTYGWLLLARGDVEGAVTELRKAALGAPDAPDIQYHFAAALVRRGESAEARGILEAILDNRREFTSREQAQALLAEL